MKKTITAICLLSGLFMAGVNTSTMAQERHERAEESREHYKDHGMEAQKRLGELKQMLNLKQSQQGAWEIFSNSMMAQQKMHMESKERMEGMHRGDYDNISTPEKLKRMSAMMRAQADSFNKMAADIQNFYDVLSTDQKTIFDLYAKNMMHAGMMEHMHAGYPNLLN